MNKLKSVFVFASFLFCSTLFAQNNFEEFKKVFATKDTSAQLAFLRQWEKTDEKDPELYVAYFNFYATHSKKEILRLDTEEGPGENLVLTDSADASVGYMYSDVWYDDTLLSKGFYYIDKGISLFPDRLDLRWGKVYMLGQSGDYKSFTEEIIRAVDYSAKNKNKWLWSFSKPQEDAEAFMLNTVQAYINQMYEAGDQYLDYMKQISEAVLKYYPDNVESLSNVAISYLMNKEYSKALELLLKAEKAAPKDAIVLNNIAYAYAEKGEKKKAIDYYEKVIKYGAEEIKEIAKEKIKQLK